MTTDLDLYALGIVTIVRWEDPPPARDRSKGNGPSRDWSVARRQLKANPGKWALVAEAVNSGHATLAFPKQSGFEATTRNHREVADGRLACDLYARYIGEVQ